MRRTARLSDPRPGFTLVELLVAMALIIMIMAILSVAFQVGMDTLSQLKSIGGLSEQLRTAQAILERDLRADHLEDPTGSPMRVSAFLPRTPAPGNPNPNPQAWTGLNRGYFNIVQRHMGSGTAGVNTNEGMDGEITSWRGSSEVFPDGSFRSPGSHILRMTVQLSGQSAQEIFVADAPAGLAGGSLSSFTPPGAPNSVVSRWAEVVYFLRPNGQFTTSNDPNTPPLPMYTLHRRQRVLADGPVLINTTGPAPSGLPANFPDLSWRVKDAGDPPAAANRLNTPADITNPVNRLGGAADPTVPAPKAFPDPLLTADHPCISPPTHQWPTGLPFPYRIPDMPAPAARFGSDVVLNNVLSLQVQAVTDPQLPVGVPAGTYQFGPDPLQSRPWAFDTASPQIVLLNPSDPNSAVNVHLKAVMVKIRVYDSKNGQTRQITVIQDM